VRADEQTADMRRERQTSGQLTAKSVSINDAKRKSDGCARKAVELTSGDLYLGRGFATEGAARRPEPRTEVSRGRSSHASGEGPNGSPAKG
jgi:hypothetical protein